MSFRILTAKIEYLMMTISMNEYMSVRVLNHTLKKRHD